MNMRNWLKIANTAKKESYDTDFGNFYLKKCTVPKSVTIAKYTKIRTANIIFVFYSRHLYKRKPLEWLAKRLRRNWIVNSFTIDCNNSTLQ